MPRGLYLQGISRLAVRVDGLIMTSRPRLLQNLFSHRKQRSCNTQIQETKKRVGWPLHFQFVVLCKLHNSGSVIDLRTNK